MAERPVVDAEVYLERLDRAGGRITMGDEKKRITFEEAQGLYPDEWIVFTEPRFNMENTTFIDGVVYFHGKSHDEALTRSAEIDGDAAIDFTGTLRYEKIIKQPNAQNKPADKAA